MTTGLLILALILIRRQRTDIRNLLSQLVADRERAWPAIKILSDLMADIANASAHSGESVHLLAKRLDLIFTTSSGESRYTHFQDGMTYHYQKNDECHGTVATTPSGPKKITQLKQTSSVMFCTEAKHSAAAAQNYFVLNYEYGGSSAATGIPNQVQHRHNGTVNSVFFDGHVGSHKIPYRPAAFFFDTSTAR